MRIGYGRRRRPFLVIGGLATAIMLLAGCAMGQTTTSAPQRTATLTRGTLVASVNATGNIQPEAELKIGFEQVGTVAQVNVKAGDVVKKGDALATLDATDLDLALAQSQAALITANSGYSRTIEGARLADITAAEAALNAAQANYTKVKTGPLPEDYADAEAGLRNAEAALRQAQNIYSASNATNPAGINGSPAAVQLEQATNNYNAAKARYDRVARGADNAQLTAAWQQVESARANLDRLKQPTRAYDLEQAEAQRKQAQIQVDLAQRRLDRATLTAPRDGVVSVVNLKVGEAVTTLPVMTLVDLSVLHIDITVDEIDVARIKPGQEVVITLDALPDTELKGKIDRIAPTSTSVGGVVSYSVRVVLGAADAALKSGMTANAAVVLERRDDVVLAPNWAVRRDKKTGQSFITIKVDEKTGKEIEVKTGLRNETFSEIVSGATEGQVILAPQTSLFSQ